MNAKPWLPKLRDDLIRSALIAIPLVMLYYLQAALTWRFEWVDRPWHVRIWNIPAGCIASEHYLWSDWLGFFVVALIVIATGRGIRSIIIRPLIRAVRH